MPKIIDSAMVISLYLVILMSYQENRTIKKVDHWPTDKFGYYKERLALAVLRSTAGFAEAVLLALDFAGVAREVLSVFEVAAVFVVHFD